MAAERCVPDKVMSLASRAELDDVVYGEKERLVPGLGDDRQFLLDLLADFGAPFLRGALGREMAREAFLGEATQIAAGGLARGNDLLGILVAQHLERKLAARGNDERLGDPCGRIDAAQRLDRPQVALAVRMQRVAGFGIVCLEPDRGQRRPRRASERSRSDACARRPRPRWGD